MLMKQNVNDDVTKDSPICESCRFMLNSGKYQGEFGRAMVSCILARP